MGATRIARCVHARCRRTLCKGFPDERADRCDCRPRSLVEVRQIGAVARQPIAVFRLGEIALAQVVQRARQRKVVRIIASAAGDRHAMIDMPPVGRAQLDAAVPATPPVPLGYSAP